MSPLFAPFTGTVATFTDSTSGTSADEYSADINWGDGNDSAGTITQSGSTFIVTGSNVFALAGSLSDTVTITDTSGATASDTATATVNGIAITQETITQADAQGFIGEVGTFTDSADPSGTDTYTATVNFGDGIWLPAEVDSCGSGVYSVVAEDDSLTQGEYTPSISIESDSGMTSSAITPPDPDALSTPSTPSFAVDSSTTAVTLSWTNVNTDDHTGYEIEEENLTDGTNYYMQQALGASATSAVVPGLTATDEYSFLVRETAPGEESYSAPVTVWMRVTTLSIANASSGTTPAVSWTVPSDGATGWEADYREQSNTLTGNTGWQWANAGAYNYSLNRPGSTITVPIYQDGFGADDGNVLFGGQTLNVRVFDTFSGGTQSNPSNVVSIDPSDSGPTPPTLSGQRNPEESEQIDLNIENYPVSGLTYRFTMLQNGKVVGQTDDSVMEDYCTDSYYAYTIDLDWGNALTVDINPNAPMVLEMNSVDSSGNMSAPSTLAIGAAPGYTPPAATTSSAGTPNAPTNLTAVSNGSHEVDLTWTDNSTNETGFDIYRSTTDNFSTATKIPSLASASVGANKTSFKDTDSQLKLGTTYYYWVTAVNAMAPTGAEQSTYDGSVSATPQVVLAFELNRVLGATTTTPNPVLKNYKYISHTFVYTVQSSATGWELLHTYSWFGDDPSEIVAFFTGFWHKDAPQDMYAARTAIAMNYMGVEFGPMSSSTFGAAVDTAFQFVAALPSDYHPNFWFVANCKEECMILENYAILIWNHVPLTILQD